jgi:hypothetical protein
MLLAHVVLARATGTRQQAGRHHVGAVAELIDAPVAEWARDRARALGVLHAEPER